MAFLAISRAFPPRYLIRRYWSHRFRNAVDIGTCVPRGGINQFWHSGCCLQRVVVQVQPYFFKSTYDSFVPACNCLDFPGPGLHVASHQRADPFLKFPLHRSIMSFGWSATDIAWLVKLCWDVVQKSRKACGEYAELTRKTLSLHAVLERLMGEARKQESPINRPGDSCRADLASIAGGCWQALSAMDEILKKYVALGKSSMNIRKL